MDVILSPLVTRPGADCGGSAGLKVGTGPRELASLTAAEWFDYLAPLCATAVRFPAVRVVVLADALPAEVRDGLARFGVEVVTGLVPPSGYPGMDARLFLARDWLTSTGSAVGRVWVIDSNDVWFVTDPFAWLDRWAPGDALAAGEEWDTYREHHAWFQQAWEPLPERFGADIRAAHLDRYPTNAGTIGGSRAAVVAALESVCAAVGTIRAHFAATGCTHNGAEVHAVNRTALAREWVGFKMDGRTPTSAGTPSPLIHNREQVTALTRPIVAGGPHPLPPLLAARIDLSQRLEGWCSADKARALAALVLDTRPACCVEIGVFGGRSLVPVALALQELGSGTVWGVDPYSDSAAVSGFGGDGRAAEQRTYWSGIDWPRIRREYLTAVVALGLTDRVRVLDAPAERAAPVFDTGSVDVLHIDGNHSPESSVADVRLWFPKVRPGGWVVFDDSQWPEVAGALSLLDAGCSVVRDYGTWRLYRKHLPSGTIDRTRA